MKKILIGILAAYAFAATPSQANGNNWGAALVGGALVGSAIAASSYYHPYYSPYAYGGSYGPYYGASYTPYYAPVYVQPTYVQPQVVIQQAPNQRPLAYFCPAVGAYYPQIQSCPTGWQVQ